MEGYLKQILEEGLKVDIYKLTGEILAGLHAISDISYCRMDEYTTNSYVKTCIYKRCYEDEDLIEYGDSGAIRLSARGRKIMDKWGSYDNYRRKIRPVLSKIKKSKEVQPYITWIVEANKLTTLSEQLWNDGFTNSGNGFKKAIKNKKPCAWNKGEGALAYLLNKLYKEKKYISVENGNKQAIFKAAQPLFYDNFKIVVKSFNLRNGLYNIKNRQAKKLSAQRDSIDNILKNL